MSEEESPPPTMADIDHTHPFDDTSPGELFLRGPTVAADGGRRGETDETRETTKTPPTMADVDHTPPTGEDVPRAFERGEGDSDDVEDADEERV